MSMRLPFTASSVSVARQRLDDWMCVHGGRHEDIEDARVVVSELVANAVRHARPMADGSIQVAWTVEPRGLQISVTDGGASTRPRSVNAPTSALAGRGMTIVGVLSRDWWTERTSSRSTVFALVAF
jgi:anti-sigma regulatory factor (Ser/Thr protein kinase)